MTHIVEPLGREAERQRILIKLAYVLSDRINREQRLKKGGREVE